MELFNFVRQWDEYIAQQKSPVLTGRVIYI